MQTYFNQPKVSFEKNYKPDRRCNR